MGTPSRLLRRVSRRNRPWRDKMVIVNIDRVDIDWEKWLIVRSFIDEAVNVGAWRGRNVAEPAV